MANITHKQVEPLNAVLRKLGASKNAEISFTVAMNIIALKTLKEALDEALAAASVSAPEYREFTEKQTTLLEKFSDVDEAGEAIRAQIQTPAGIAFRYQLNDPEGYAEEFEKLKEEYTEAIEAEDTRQKSLVALMDKETEVEIASIKKGWCDGILDGNDVVVLLECGVIEIPSEVPQVDTPEAAAEA